MIMNRENRMVFDIGLGRLERIEEVVGRLIVKT